jgi:hypothetical protein
MTPTQEVDHTFDNLSRMLADESVSRGRALRLLGAALVGGLLASIPGGAKAAPVDCSPFFPQECGRTCCEADEVCCGKGGNAGCCPSGHTCCQKGQDLACCTPEEPICCSLPGGGVGCADTVASCEAEGGRPR